MRHIERLLFSSRILSSTLCLRAVKRGHIGDKKCYKSEAENTKRFFLPGNLCRCVRGLHKHLCMQKAWLFALIT